MTYQERQQRREHLMLYTAVGDVVRRALARGVTKDEVDLAVRAACREVEDALAVLDA